MITEAEFKAATGNDPEDDDMDRVNCNVAGDVGHTSCGWCDIHNKPMFQDYQCTMKRLNINISEEQSK